MILKKLSFLILTNLHFSSILLFIIFFQACGPRVVPLVEDRSLFRPVINGKKILEGGDLEKYPTSIASTVKVSSKWGSRTFDQVLITRDKEFRLSVYAPNFVQLISTLSGSGKNWIYCDFLGHECWSEESEIEEIGVFGPLMRTKGFNLAKFIRGMQFQSIEDGNVKVYNDDQGRMLAEIRDGDWFYEILFRNKQKGLIQVEKYLSSINGERVVEVTYLYSKDLEAYPSSINVVLPQDDLVINFNQRSFSKIATQLSDDIFSFSLPDGFKLH